MALTQTIALLGLVLKDDNLLALAVFHHGGVHGSAFHHGGAELGRVAQDGQDLVKLDGVTGFLGQLLDEQNVAFRDLILLSAGSIRSSSFCFSFCLVIQAAPVPAGDAVFLYQGAHLSVRATMERGSPRHDGQKVVSGVLAPEPLRAVIKIAGEDGEHPSSLQMAAQR